MVILLTVLELLKEVLRVTAGPLTAVLVGGYFLQKFFVSRSNEAAFIDHLVESLTEFRDESCKYWNLAADNAEALELEPKIKADFQSISIDLIHFNKKYCMKSLPFWSRKVDENDDGLEDSEFTPVLLKIMRETMGDTFETRTRVPNPSKYLSITVVINELKCNLLMRKL